MSLEAVDTAGTNPTMPEADDYALLALVARDEVEAFDRLYRRYYKRVFGFVARITQRIDVTDEVVNDTMLTVWRKAGEFAGRSRPSTWIFGIAYRKALKAAKSVVEADEVDLEAIADHRQAASFEAILLRDQLARALGQLPPEQRAVVELTYLHGYKYTEIAAIADCPVGTIKTRMHNARKKLRLLLVGPATEEKGDG